MEESVLRYRTAGPDAMRGQLRHLLAVMPLASVSLGIIPFTAQRTVWPLEAFYLHDDDMAVVETLTAEIKVTQPRELADYTKAFTGLAEMAVYGDTARALIRAAIDALELPSAITRNFVEDRAGASVASNDADAPSNGGGAHERTHTRRHRTGEARPPAACLRPALPGATGPR